jgi:hypothetical protein
MMARMTEPHRRPDELLLDELTDQLDRTRRLLTGSPADAAERALSRIGGDSEIDARLASELVAPPLAAPDRFGEAHRLVMRALEVLDRDGHRAPRVAAPGPLRPLASAAVEFVARYIVRSFTHRVVGDLAALYARREVQAAPRSDERRLLAAARAELQRLEPRYGGGGLGAPAVLVAGAAVPALASLAQRAGAIDVDARWLFPGAIALVGLFALLAWFFLRGAAVARHRSRLIAGRPLEALWQTIGHAGDVPEDDSMLFATIALVLTALVWFALPALIAVGFLLF